MQTYAVTLLLAFLTSLALTPLVRRWTLEKGIVDQAGSEHRKLHKRDTPRLGGIALVAAFYVPILGLLIYETSVGQQLLAQPLLAYGLLGGGLAIAALGLYDDLFGSSATIKLVVQIAVAIVAVELGFKIERVSLPFFEALELGVFAYPVTVLWIVGVTNAVNLIDGLDGLAAGVALCAIVPVLVLGFINGLTVMVLISCALIGGLLGFLVYNTHPARIFMGDTGSMFLGFVLALVTVQTSLKGPATVAMLTPILALGLPIMDTLLAMARRMWLGKVVFSADTDHIHHRLMQQGLSHKSTVLFLYGFGALLAALGIAISLQHDREAGLVLGVAVVVVAVLMRRLGYLELKRPRSLRRVRRSNRQLRHLVSYLSLRVSSVKDVHEVEILATELARAAGATTCSLDTSITDAQEDPPRLGGGQETVQVPLKDSHGRAAGVLFMVFPKDQTLDSQVEDLFLKGSRHVADMLARVKPACEPRPRAAV